MASSQKQIKISRLEVQLSMYLCKFASCKSHCGKVVSVHKCVPICRANSTPRALELYLRSQSSDSQPEDFCICVQVINQFRKVLQKLKQPNSKKPLKTYRHQKKKLACFSVTQVVFYLCQVDKKSSSAEDLYEWPMQLRYKCIIPHALSFADKNNC